MGWTKRQLVAEAFSELALAGYEFDLSPEEELAALRKLNQLIATWAGQGINIGYAFGLTPEADDLDDDSGLALVDVESVTLNLAVRLAASKGKALMPTTTRAAKQAYDAMVCRMAQSDVQQQQLPSGTPRGAGRKSWRGYISPFFPRPDTEPLGIDSNNLTLK